MNLFIGKYLGIGQAQRGISLLGLTQNWQNPKFV